MYREVRKGEDVVEEKLSLITLVVPMVILFAQKSNQTHSLLKFSRKTFWASCFLRQGYNLK